MKDLKFDGFYDVWREELESFPRTKRFTDLEEMYWRNPAMLAEQVTPLWDLNRSSLRWNWELSPDEIARCHLVEGVLTFEIGRSMYKPAAYRFPGNWNEMKRDQTLLVVDHWLRGIPLTPPVIVYHQDGTWGKRDGYHRLVIALMCVPPEIPVWVLKS